MDRVTHEGYASLKTTLENVRNTMYDTTSVSKSIAYSMLTRIVLYYSNSTSQTPSINSRCRAYRQGISYEHCLTLPATEVIYEEPHIQGGTLSRGSSSKTRHFYYDDHSRLTLLKESYNDGWTSVYSWQNDFTGNVLKHTEEHYNNQHFDSMVITYTYDKRGRRRTMTRNLNGVEFAPVSYDYDAFGRMRVKKVEGRGYEVYGYNLQGWQDCSSAYFYGYDLFSQTMTYQHPFLRESEARYDGLVSEVMYRHLGQDTHTVAYGYDGVGRLASSCRYLNRDSTACHTWSEDAMEYDLNGNLIFMARINNNHVEDIWKEYQGNRMIWSSILGNGDNHYDYYADGNLKTDPCRNLQIQYNMLNLPAVVTEADGQSPKARYYYFADGSRYRVYDASGNGYVYRGTFVYNLSPTGMERLESVGHDEGRFIALSSSAATTQFIDTWHVKDYLGNVRVVLDITNDTSVVVHPSFAVLEQDDYLPFGTRADLDSLAYDPSNRYRFNGKEEQVIGNIGLIDYGARFYDPDLSRWTTPDPLAEKYYSISPYAFCNNNPVNFVDPDGRFPDIIWDVASIGMGIDSFLDNYRAGKYGAAIFDGVGIAVDVVAAFIPVVPGGVGILRTGNRVLNIADAGIDALKLGDELSSFSYAAGFGVDSYKNLKKSVEATYGTGSGLEVHHLIEKRFAKQMGMKEVDMPSIVLTKDEHKQFTAAWNKAIGHRNTSNDINTETADYDIIIEKARTIYKDYPELLKVIENAFK